MYFRRFTSGNASQVFNPNKYLTIEALEDISITVTGTFSLILIKIGNGEWSYLIKGNGVSINKGECVYLKSDITYSVEVHIAVLGRFRVKGNYMSLLYMDKADSYDEVCCEIRNLFANNEGLVEVSPTFLPATTLTSYCYSNMFYGCTGLTKAPELPATTLAGSCYSKMFYNCSRLNHIKMLATYVNLDSYLENWVNGVSSTGTFVKSKDAKWDTTPGALGASGVPAGWTVITE